MKNNFLNLILTTLIKGVSVKNTVTILSLVLLSYSSLAFASSRSCETANSLGDYTLNDNGAGVVATFSNKSESYQIGGVGARRQIIEIKVLDGDGTPVSLEHLLADDPIPLNNVLSSLIADLPLDFKQLSNAILEARKNLHCK